MAAANYDLLVEQGQDHRFVLTLSNLSLVGYTAEMQIRKTVKTPEVELELSTINGKLFINEDENTIFIAIDETDSFLVTSNSVYDLFVESPTGERKRIIYGKIELRLAVTRD